MFLMYEKRLQYQLPQIELGKLMGLPAPWMQKVELGKLTAFVTLSAQRIEIEN